jgi:hypothetical protein
MALHQLHIAAICSECARVFIRPRITPHSSLMLSAVLQVLRIVVEESHADGAARHVTGTWHDH